VPWSAFAVQQIRITYGLPKHRPGPQSRDQPIHCRGSEAAWSKDRRRSAGDSASFFWLKAHPVTDAKPPRANGEINAEPVRACKNTKRTQLLRVVRGPRSDDSKLTAGMRLKAGTQGPRRDAIRPHKLRVASNDNVSMQPGRGPRPGRIITSLGQVAPAAGRSSFLGIHNLLGFCQPCALR
jgi:hypothetical protein